MSGSAGDSVDGFIDALLDDQPEQLYDRAPCGYLSTSADGTIIKVNRTFLTLTGYEREELVGRVRFAELLSAGGKIYHETHYAPMLSMAGTAREIALDVVRRDGSRLPVLVNAVLDRDDAGAPAVIRTAVFDATHRREYERELLRQRDRAEKSEEHAKALARALQRALIPPAPPVIPQLDLAARYRPAGDGSEVGGDFYDVFQIGTDDWVVAVGDVRGKGTEAAVVTALVRHTLRAAAVQTPSAVDALAVVNTALRESGTDRFCTVALLRLQRTGQTWSVRLSAAGHPLPLQRRRDGSVVALGEPGLILGVRDVLAVHETRLTLQRGETLVIYTDGVPDGRCGTAFYGDDRIVSIVAESGDTAATMADAVLDDVLRFQNGVASDDIVIVAIRVPG